MAMVDAADQPPSGGVASRREDHATGAVVAEGDTVILDVNSEKQAFVTIRRSGLVRVGKAQCSVDPLIGAQYGSQFEVAADGRLRKRKALNEAIEEWEAVPEVLRNNSKLLDAGAAHQQLTPADIQALRAAGVDGAGIVQALAANSATFATKTEFSQDKYKKRKAKKYVTVATVIRPTARAIAEAYFAKSPAHTAWLRADTLALLLLHANVGAHARVLVVESCGGLVAGAAAERLGGHGQVVAAYFGMRTPALDVARLFNFPQHVAAALAAAPLSALLAAREPQPAAGPRSGAEPGDVATVPVAPMPQAVPEPQAGVQSRPPLANGVSQGEPGTTGLEADTAAATPHTQSGSAMGQPPKADEVQVETAGAELCPAQAAESGQAATPLPPQGQARAYVLKPHIAAAARQGFTSCLLASPQVAPITLVRKALPLLAPSACFAVFSNWLQPLAECMMELQVSKQAVALQLQESWWRQHQVLPGRTHPEMDMSGTGGYILAGIKTV